MEKKWLLPGGVTAEWRLKMVKVGLVLLFLVLGGSPSWAEEVWTCAHWNRQSEVSRLFYVMGLRDGMLAGIATWITADPSMDASSIAVQPLSNVAPIHFDAELRVICRKTPTMNFPEVAILAVHTVLREKGALPLKPPR